MNRTRRQTARLLGLAGLIPFIALAGAAHFGAPGWIERLLIGYPVAILAFLSGTLWLGSLRAEADQPEALVASNLLVLAGLAALVLPLPLAAGWLAVLFASQFVAEQRWIARDQASWYRRLRTLLSGVAVLLLALASLAALNPEAPA